MKTFWGNGGRLWEPQAKAGNGLIVAIVSGGNIDLQKFCELIAEREK
jgi:hypothetical protein